MVRRILANAKSQGVPVVLDGALGTQLEDRGVRLPEGLWSSVAALDCPELLAQIHREYVEAGADVLTTGTFRTRARLFAAAKRPANQWERAARRSVEIARSVAGAAAIAGSVGPLEDCFCPAAAPDRVTSRREHEPLCRILVESGIDILWLETFGTLREIDGALEAALAATAGSAIPIALCVTTARSGELVSGEPLSSALSLAVEAGVLVAGINCVPVGHVPAAFPALRAGGVPNLCIYSNLGVPEPTQDWTGSAHLSPAAYAQVAAQWVAQGVEIVGACCGSSPAHIKALRAASWLPPPAQ